MTCEITTLFLDIGNVLLTNGWDHHMREAAANKFSFDSKEFEKRHAQCFGTYELGKMTLDKYLEYTIFYTARSFSKTDFKEFIYLQSQAFNDMLNFFKKLKSKGSYKIVAVSNEGLELMKHRYQKFALGEIFDFVVCSSIVGLKKPDRAIYELALNLSMTKPAEVVYIDDRDILTEIAASYGFNVICHRSFEETKKILQSKYNIT